MKLSHHHPQQWPTSVQAHSVAIYFLLLFYLYIYIYTGIYRSPQRTANPPGEFSRVLCLRFFKTLYAHISQFIIMIIIIIIIIRCYAIDGKTVYYFFEQTSEVYGRYSHILILIVYKYSIADPRIFFIVCTN